MKKLLILTTFLSSLIMSSVAHAKWTKVTEGESGSTFYVDLERIKKHSGKVYFWSLDDYGTPTEYGSISAKSYNEVECGSFRSRTLNYKYYTGPMGSGTINSSNKTPAKDWSYPEPYSVHEHILKAVCNHKSMQ